MASCRSLEVLQRLPSYLRAVRAQERARIAGRQSEYPRGCRGPSSDDEAGAEIAKGASPVGCRPLRIAAAPVSQAMVRPWCFSGKLRYRFPVAAVMALSTAGAATAMVGSPTPPQKPAEGITIVSTFGIWAMRIMS
jgi:hypothetical protein